MDIHRYGDRALLIDLEPAHVTSTSEPKNILPRWDPAALAAAARARFGLTITEAVPAEHTVLLVFRTSSDAIAASAILNDLDGSDLTSNSDLPTRVVSIPVSYGGPDLESVAHAVGLSVEALITAHTTTTFRVAFFGFAPGFAYLIGLPPALHVARRATPRTHVPAGAVAIAAHYAAIYPRASPGGWHLIGHTDAILFDPDRQPPSLLEPGSMVQFHAT